ncbi:hypothetical protein ANAPC5_01425 [Anaplasma phagocytophilum]|nr:hypothetical protein ANAPC5_01425 [Anaplasma phagocytophilum]
MFIVLPFQLSTLILVPGRQSDLIDISGHRSKACSQNSLIDFSRHRLEEATLQKLLPRPMAGVSRAER